MFGHDSFTPIFTPLMKVTIEQKKGRLLLRWTCPATGQRKNLAIGVEDSTTGKAYAQSIKCQIENDAKFGYYDPTLLKYKPRTIGRNATEITTIELFDRFTKHQFKSKGLAQSSIDSRYEPIKRMLEKYLNVQAAAVDKRRTEKFADVCEDTLTTGDTAKARISLLKSAWDWGKDRYQLSNENPWVGIAKRFRSTEVQPSPKFSVDEVRKIIQGFRDSPYYAHYVDYVRFRFGTGTRPGEASGLKWQHISSDFQSVWIGKSYSRGVTGSTKTKKARTFKILPSISAMLSTRRELLNPKSDEYYVFTTSTGLPIDDRNFRRAWKKVLASVGVAYRKPYTTRKTQANHSLKAGNNYIEVAEALGHDPHTMHDSYVEAFQEQSVFVDFE